MNEPRPNLRSLLKEVLEARNNLRQPGVAGALCWELLEAIVIWAFWGRLRDGGHD